MPHELPKAYDPTAIEDHWAEYWVREKLFEQPTPAAGDKSEGHASEQFSILLPPPNVTGRLHMGHMLNQTEMDILTRWRRMSGYRALWLPGTDHAGIATQMMVERQLAAENTSREKLGREAFVERVWEWKRHYGGAILDQMKRLGASVDWSREYFTMDARLSVAVREAFVRLYEQGLIYRGAYIVNWCPRCQTAISDLEVVYDEHKGHLWEIRYPVIDDAGKDTGEYVTIATTRPETMLGDVAVAVHPEDERYTHLHGKKLRLPLPKLNPARQIPIVTDDWVTREFGTGAVKVTPAHDPNDFALGERHHLPSISVMDATAQINENGGQYAGLDRYIARKRIITDLEAQGLLAGVKDHVHNVGHCDRCKTIVEPRLSTQWFIAVNKKAEGRGVSMAELAIAAVKAGADGKKAMRFTPEMYEKTYLNWMEGIHDWCISRQLWWGHRIPAWHCAACHKITVARQDPSACSHCGSSEITQETDVLDTWFSSGLLPVSVFGWPNIGPDTRADFDTFYPTSLLVTGFDILFFWVARMVMLGCWFSTDVPMADGSARPLAESVPFREVYIHALVRDANREKMSKTKGNVIDPIEIVKQYGTDAVRFTLASMASPGTDIAFNVARTEGYRAFANKIWNAARFIFMSMNRAAEAGIGVDPSLAALNLHLGPGEGAPADRAVTSQLAEATRNVKRALEAYRFDEASSLIYQFFWRDFCDSYIESSKPKLILNGDTTLGALGQSLNVMVGVFETSLRLLSPFMPFLTEEIWHALYAGKPPFKSIALSRFPSEEVANISESAEREMAIVNEVISSHRAARKERSLGEKTPLDLRVFFHDPSISFKSAKELINANVQVIQVRANTTSNIEVVHIPIESPTKRATRTFELDIPNAPSNAAVDVAAERERLTKEIAKYEKGLAAAERQLGNEGFLAKAPAHVVEGLRKQESETRLLLEKARTALASLPPA